MSADRLVRVLVCGGRDFNDSRLLARTLYDLCVERQMFSDTDEYGNWLPDGLMIVHGGARGADRMADEWAVVNWVPVEEHKADWKTHGKAAGPIRNQQMLASGIDLVVAFPGGNGTKDMIRRAKKAGVEVIEIEAR